MAEVKIKPAPAAVETPKPAVAETSTPKPEAAAPAAGTLAAARKLKSDNPAEGYAAFKAIVKASPGSSDARAAAVEIAATAGDATLSKTIMASETKAHSSRSMAENFQNRRQ